MSEIVYMCKINNDEEQTSFGNYNDMCWHLRDLDKTHKAFIVPGEEYYKGDVCCWRRLFNHNNYEQWDKSVAEAMKYFTC
eukprot:SAG22_NODE_10926_length_509_cov_1.085366_1_plen_80_part_00